jgi:SAM-dependent methyltransferase
MDDSTHYVIRGGIEGRERLRVLGRVMRDTTVSLFERIGVRSGLSCVDLGCGGGDATLDIARRVAPDGRVLGLDIDRTKLEIARAEAKQQGLANVEFQFADLRDGLDASDFDLAYSRFLLTHLSDPAGALSTLSRVLRPRGLMVLEDIDFSGCFTHPESGAFRRYHELYCAAARRRGGDPDIGPRLPGLLKQCGFEDIQMNVVQPIGMSGEVKLLNPLTMENIAGSVLEDRLASREEIDGIVRDLYAFAADPDTVAGTPRIVQAWGRLPLA